MTSNSTQVGGDHYAKGGDYQVWDFILETGLSYLEGNAVKYIVRYMDKNGAVDLDKALHYLQKQEECGRYRSFKKLRYFLWDRERTEKLAYVYNLRRAQVFAISGILVGDLSIARTWVRLLKMSCN